MTSAGRTSKLTFGIALGCAILPGALALAQCAAPGGSGCFVSPQNPQEYGCHATPSLAPSPQPSGDKEQEKAWLTWQRGVATAGAVVGGTKVIQEVGTGARTAVAGIDLAKKVPVYGPVAKSLPIIGKSAAAVRIPTSVGGMPIIGSAVKEIPIVGSTIAGPPPPWLVGAVAVDTYLLPKVSPSGCTESSVFTMTDFNSPPRLRHYVNYLAPMAYTHPPIYAADLSAAAASGREVEAPAGTVNIEH